VRSLDPATPAGAVLLNRAARSLRGAGYAAFDGTAPDQPAHAAVAAVYAHVTAPLRRLADRFANEVLLALDAGRPVPAWARDALPDLPAVMTAASRRQAEIERAAVDGAEALVLAGREGEEFDATVITTGKGGSTLQLCDPAVVGSLAGGTAEPGDRIRVRLTEADPLRRTVAFAPA
jgi:exoribonuclease R